MGLAAAQVDACVCYYLLSCSSSNDWPGTVLRLLLWPSCQQAPPVHLLQGNLQHGPGRLASPTSHYTPGIDARHCRTCCPVAQHLCPLLLHTQVSLLCPGHPTIVISEQLSLLDLLRSSPPPPTSYLAAIRLRSHEEGAASAALLPLRTGGAAGGAQHGSGVVQLLAHAVDADYRCGPGPGAGAVLMASRPSASCWASCICCCLVRTCRPEERCHHTTLAPGTWHHTTLAPGTWHHTTLAPGMASTVTCCWLHLRRAGMYGMPAVADVPQGDSSSSDQGPSAPRRLLRQLSK